MQTSIQRTPDTKLTLPKAATIQQIDTDNYRTKTFVLDARIDATPGQFIMAWLPRFDEKPFSLVNCDPITLMITSVGPFTRLVHEKQVGETLWLRGAFGNPFSLASTQKNIALIGGGYGVAPLLWLAQTAHTSIGTIHVIIGAGTERDLLYVDRFQQLAASPAHPAADENLLPRLQLHVVTEDGSQGDRGRVTDVLSPLLADKKIDGIYGCGPHGMLHALDTLGTEHDVPCQLSWEAYMRCGIGICGACEHNGHLLCMDGPVLHS